MSWLGGLALMRSFRYHHTVHAHTHTNAHNDLWLIWGSLLLNYYTTLCMNTHTPYGVYVVTIIPVHPAMYDQTSRQTHTHARTV